MSNEIINDWKPETKSLIRTLRKHGFEMVKADNGEESEDYKTDDQLIACLTACDESHLFVRFTATGRQHWLFLVYGNEPGELPSDYSLSREPSPSNTALDKATQEHYERWELRGQPKMHHATR